MEIEKSKFQITQQSSSPQRDNYKWRNDVIKDFKIPCGEERVDFKG